MNTPHPIVKRTPLGAGMGIGVIAGFAITSQNGVWVLVCLGACVCWIIMLRTHMIR